LPRTVWTVRLRSPLGLLARHVRRSQSQRVATG
jgi:hypothetical protein